MAQWLPRIPNVPPAQGPQLPAAARIHTALVMASVRTYLTCFLREALALTSLGKRFGVLDCAWEVRVLSFIPNLSYLTVYVSDSLA